MNEPDPSLARTERFSRPAILIAVAIMTAVALAVGAPIAAGTFLTNDGKSHSPGAARRRAPTLDIGQGTVRRMRLTAERSSKRRIASTAHLHLLRRAQTATSPAAPSEGPYKLACPSVTLCVATDANGEVLTSTNPGAGDSKWTTSDVDGSTPITAISCPTVTMCVATDAAGNVLTSTNPLGGSAAWSASQVDGVGLTGVSCPTISLCIAIDSRGNIAVSTTVSSASPVWTVTHVDRGMGYECFHYGPTAGNCQAGLTAVSCPSTTLCYAVDTAGNLLTSSNPTGGAAAWSGGRALSVPPGEAFDGVACATVSFCAVVDYGLGNVITWDPSTGWSARETTHISKTNLLGITCQSSSLCVGFDDIGSLFESTDASVSTASWDSMAATPSGTYVSTVACPSSTLCVALSDAGGIYTTQPSAVSSDLRDRVSRHVRLRFRKSGSIYTRTIKRLTLASLRRHLRLSAPRNTVPGGRRFFASLASATGAGPPFALHRSEPSSLPTATVAPRIVSDAGSTNPSYGISEAQAQCVPNGWTDQDGTYQCTGGWGYGFPTYSTSETFLNLKTSGVSLGYVRFFVPYDAVESYYPTINACGFSPALVDGDSAFVPGQSWEILFAELRAAQAAHLTPLVSLVKGTGVTGSYGNAGMSSPPQVPDPLTTADDENYECGVEGLLNATASNGVPVTEWEAWNEPDADYPTAAGYCAGESISGADIAAGFWANMYYVDTTVEHRSDTIAAGTFSWPWTSYLNEYSCFLHTLWGDYPTTYSVHDYSDVSSYEVVGSTPEIYNFDEDLWALYVLAARSTPPVWITETAVLLTDGDTSFSNNKSASQCDVVYNSRGGTLGGCLDGDELAQSQAAEGFVSLGADGDYSSGEIARVYWYQFRPENEAGWDSGLLSPPACPHCASAQVSPDGNYSMERQSYCVLAASSGCSTSNVDAAAWSMDPSNFTGVLADGSSELSSVTPDPSGSADYGAWITCSENGVACSGVPSGIPPDDQVYLSESNAIIMNLAANASGQATVTVSDDP